MISSLTKRFKRLSKKNGPKIVYLNGKFLPLSKAKISVLDRGFLFADGVYEVIPYRAHFFHLAAHLKRLDESLKAIGLKNPMTDEAWHALLNQLLNLNELQKESTIIYLQITRGQGEKRTHLFSKNMAPTIFIMTEDLKEYDYKTLSKGFSAITLPDNRGLKADIKSIDLLPNILARQAAAKEDAVEALFIRDQNLVEGATSNVFIISAGKILTPPKSPFLLGGITREVVIDLAQKAGIPLEETKITEKMLKNAQEIWITSVTKNIMPIITLDHTPVGSGKVGSIWQKMITLFQEEIK